MKRAKKSSNLFIEANNDRDLNSIKLVYYIPLTNTMM